MGLSDEQFHQLIQGEWLLTPDLAKTLERVLGPPARFWMGLEAAFRRNLAKVQTDNQMFRFHVFHIRIPEQAVPWKRTGRIPWPSKGRRKQS